MFFFVFNSIVDWYNNAVATGGGQGSSRLLNNRTTGCKQCKEKPKKEEKIRSYKLRSLSGVVSCVYEFEIMMKQSSVLSWANKT